MTSRFEFPGFIDLHVHFRDPGMPAAETTESGLAAAAAGGFAAVVTMPNTTPAVDSPEAIAAQFERRRRFAESRGGRAPLLLPSAAITRSRAGAACGDIERLAEAGAALFTDDGAYVAADRVMEEAMRRAAKCGVAVCDHALDPRIVKDGVMRDCPLARRLGLAAIPPEAETAAVARDISVCRTTGCRLHIQHISTARGAELVAEARKEGLPVTAEATPHHLLFACDDIESDDANFKMAPPLGNREDRAELRRRVLEGALMFATDHAPHPSASKSAGFARSANGITGLETAVSATWKAMVEEEGMQVEAWARAWRDMPLGVLSPSARALVEAEGAKTEIEVGNPRPADVSKSLSLSRNCPYGGIVFACRPAGAAV